MPKYLEKLKQFASPLGKGLLAEAIPGFASGILNEFFRQWQVDVPKITEDILRDRSLWGEMGSNERRQLAQFAKKIDSLDFVTPEWFIKSIKKDFPAVASLFLNWPEAADWLNRQITELKTKVVEE